MMRIAIFWVFCFLLLAACEALCQKRPSADLSPGSQPASSNSAEARRQRTWNSLPDAPTPVQPLPEAQRFDAFNKETSSPTSGTRDVSAGEKRETEPGDVSQLLQTRLAFFQSVPLQRESAVSAFLGKYLYPPLINQDSRNCFSMNGSFMDRASCAASRVFVTRDESGKMKLNTSFFLRALTLATIHFAYHPYWDQPVPARSNNFASTVGGEVGTNVLHQFAPDIGQIVRGHTAKFVSGMGEHITRAHTWKDVPSGPLR